LLAATHEEAAKQCKKSHAIFLACNFYIYNTLKANYTDKMLRDDALKGKNCCYWRR
jgi:hypothetical protein